MHHVVSVVRDAHAAASEDVLGSKAVVLHTLNGGKFY